MQAMKKWFLLLAAAWVFTPAVRAQEFSEDPYEFILAKLAAQDSRYDEALSRIDKIVARHPDNMVLQFERAMIQERVRAGLARTRAAGTRLGRRRASMWFLPAARRRMRVESQYA